ncbi:MAG: hypothetical protein JWM35_2046, partial [Verrucomicrobia bacterium]|nr:hypothetical protein [Verrucomicrobiota bacterium]
VEGHAHHALAGAAKTLAATRPVLIVAFHSADEVNGVRAVLDPLGYESSPIATDSGHADAVIGHDLLFRPRHK